LLLAKLSETEWILEGCRIRVVETSLPAAVAALPIEAVRTTEPEGNPPTIDAIIEADKELIDEVTVMEEPPVFTEQQPPVFKSHRTAPVESKPLEPIAPEVWNAIDVNKVTSEEREGILHLDAKAERLAIIAQNFKTSIPEIHRILIAGVKKAEL
jgi:hypothetical protein